MVKTYMVATLYLPCIDCNFVELIFTYPKIVISQSSHMIKKVDNNGLHFVICIYTV